MLKTKKFRLFIFLFFTSFYITKIMKIKQLK